MFTRYLTFVGFQTLTRSIFKGAMRSNAKAHASLIAVQEYQLNLEKDLYARLHPEPAKAETPNPAR